MEEGKNKRSNREEEILQKVADFIREIRDAKHVDDIIVSLHSLAIHLFPVNSTLLSGAVDFVRRDQILKARVPTAAERDEWYSAFYWGTAYPTLSRVLLYDIASDWLVCFPLSARLHIYDSFFVNAPPTETLQSLLSVLTSNKTGEKFQINAICSNAERLLILCFLENDGVLKMMREFGEQCRNQEVDGGLRLADITYVSKMAQMVASIPDKASFEAPAALRSHLFYKKIISQLFVGAENLRHQGNLMNSTYLFISEVFTRICRRGSTDILAARMWAHILELVQSCLPETIDDMEPHLIAKDTRFGFWMMVIETLNDPYAIERLSEELLRQLASQHVNDSEAYWVLWTLFHSSLNKQNNVRSIFVDKFLIWKVFPICCLRWIIQLAIVECPPNSNGHFRRVNSCILIDTVQKLIKVWSKKEFVQTAPIEQQAYITAAVGLTLERLSKEELEMTKDVLHSLLHGVSCRLESPIHLVRKMASCVALVFSKIIDPNNLLYLDDSCREETIDWEFGLSSQQKRSHRTSVDMETSNGVLEANASTVQNKVCLESESRKSKDKSDKFSDSHKKLAQLKVVDPDEIVDPADLQNDSFPDSEDDVKSNSSYSSTDSSLQPYDLADDISDLQNNLSQLSDVLTALRKSDDPDGVQRALDVTEKFVRAESDELLHISGDLVKLLIHVRCSEVTIEGEEESAENKRHRALVALLVTCPFESLEVSTKLLYSPNVDVSQRILILDVMTDAIQELANTKVVRSGHHSHGLISPISGNEPWFLPSNQGPPEAGPWKQTSEAEISLSWSYRYERVLPSRSKLAKSGKSRMLTLKQTGNNKSKNELSMNKFPVYAAAFMLPVMQGYDKKSHGVDFLGRDFIVLGKLIYMLGVCMKCTAMHPEAAALTPALLDMLQSREVCNHVETYVRRSVLYAASCILMALHPSYIVSVLLEGNQEISEGLEWIRKWALHIAESDSDTECSTLAMTCLQLHAEMALQASRYLESTNDSKTKGITLTSKSSQREIVLPFSNMKI